MVQSRSSSSGAFDHSMNAAKNGGFESCPHSHPWRSGRRPQSADNWKHGQFNLDEYREQ